MLGCCNVPELVSVAVLLVTVVLILLLLDSPSSRPNAKPIKNNMETLPLPIKLILSTLDYNVNKSKRILRILNCTTGSTDP